MLVYIQVKNVEEAKKAEIAIEKAAPIWYNVIDKKTNPKEEELLIHMLRNNGNKQLNFYSTLYQNIPKNHILKSINSAISFEFVNKLLEDRYCKNFGRPAKEPELMIKLLMLQHLYNLSDERVILATQTDLAFMWFIGINPDDTLPHHSLLSKFRTMRLQGLALDDILSEVIRQCVEKQIINAENGWSIDTTHVHANTVKKTPERIMKHLAKKIFKAMCRDDYDIPDYKHIADHKEARHMMKDYLEGVMSSAESVATNEVTEANEILTSPLFMEQKGIRSISDKDARVGYKSRTESFYGYKMEYGLTTEGQLITSVGVHSGAYVDGSEFSELLKQGRQAGLKINSVYADKAYFKKDILKELKASGTAAYIPVSASSYRIDEDMFSYNKDSDEWICVRGNRSVSKKTVQKKQKGRKPSTVYMYRFDKKDCTDCPLRDDCIKGRKAKARSLSVGDYAGEYYQHSQWAKTQEFIEEYMKRASIEWKNAEMKRFHGLARARGFGLPSITRQAKLTALAVNLKKIVTLIGQKEKENSIKIVFSTQFDTFFGRVFFSRLFWDKRRWMRTV